MRRRRLPSPATVIACIALVGAWGGPALADALITGGDVRNGSLTGRDVKNRSLSGRDLRSNTVTGRNVKGLSGRDLKPDSVDGFQIFEENLGEVPRAREAARADRVGPTAPVRIRAALAAGDERVVLEEGGLRIRVACEGAGQVEVTASTALDAALIRASVIKSGQGATYADDDDFRTTDTFNLLPSGRANALGQLLYVAPSGAVVSFDYFADEGTTAMTPSGGCIFGAHGLASNA